MYFHIKIKLSQTLVLNMTEALSCRHEYTIPVVSIGICANLNIELTSGAQWDHMFLTEGNTDEFLFRGKEAKDSFVVS